VQQSTEQLVEIPGQDSFLDVITNIVGILILLVLIVGIRTSRTVASAIRAEAAASTAGGGEQAGGAEQFAAAYQAAINARNEINELIKRSVDVHQESLLREEERNLLATFVAAGERDIRDRRAQLNVEQQRDFDLRRQLGEAQQALDDLGRQRVALLTQAAESEVVENLPTPLAKTVTGEEIHLRLAERHVAVVPIEKLHEAAEEHFERNVWRLREQGAMEGSVGPIDGFRLRYRIRVSQVTVPTRSGFEQSRPVVQEKYEYVPVSLPIGEPVDQAVLANSNLLQTLRRMSPANTTVTIWTYPDSFEEFRQLKKALFDLGFAAAGRPLPAGEVITASPSGTRSAAQ
jgi:hypothetical protein